MASFASAVPATRITEDILQSAGFSVTTLISMGYNDPVQLKFAGFDAQELREAGLTAVSLRCASFSPEELRLGGYAAGVRITNYRSRLFINSFCTHSEGEVARAGFSAMRLCKAGYSGSGP